MKKKVEAKKSVKPKKVKASGRVPFRTVCKKVNTIEKTNIKKSFISGEPLDEVIHGKEIVEEIQSFIKRFENLNILARDNKFILMVCTKNLNVTNVCHNSVFQPYETSETKQYTCLSIIKVREWKSVAYFIPDLIKIGCPVYKISNKEGIPDLIDKILND